MLMHTHTADRPESDWPVEWAPIKGMGGCTAIAMARATGLMCATDLAASAMVQGLAPGISGSLCDMCAASCKVDEQECSVPAHVAAAASLAAATDAPPSKSSPLDVAPAWGEPCLRGLAFFLCFAWQQESLHACKHARLAHGIAHHCRAAER